MDQELSQEAPPAQESSWGGVEDNMDDPEEVRVIFSALDSFSYVDNLPIAVHSPEERCDTVKSMEMLANMAQSIRKNCPFQCHPSSPAVFLRSSSSTLEYACRPPI